MIYKSSRIRLALAEGVSEIPYGFAHYSYANVCRKFMQLFRSHDIEITDLPMPEIYASVDSAPDASSDNAPHVHLCFKPFDEIRLLKGAVNIAWVAWEFDQLPSFNRNSVDDSRRWNVFNDYVCMLNKLDEVWVSCSYTREVFRKEGVCNVQVMPAPIAVPNNRGKFARGAVSVEAGEPSLAKVDADHASVAGLIFDQKPSGRSIFSRLHQARRLGGRVFLSIFNPGDMRKNAPALLAGFQRHIQKSRSNDILIVKFVVDGTHRTLATVLRDEMPLRFHQFDLNFGLIDTRNITYVSGTLSEAGMEWLYRAADFYLCASLAEGQNLPMLEAISFGIVPVSTSGTAMSDYISTDAACVIQTNRRPMAHGIASAYGLANIQWNWASFWDVAKALDDTLHLSPERLESMRSCGLRVVQDNFGENVILSRVQSRLAAHGCCW